MGVAPIQVHLIETLEDVENLTVNNEKLTCNEPNNDEPMGRCPSYGSAQSQISTY